MCFIKVQTELSSKKEEYGGLKSQSNELKEKLKHLENKYATLEASLAKKVK